MDLPEEDKTAIAKRRAIQTLMRNKSYTPAERHEKMQSIMKGNFDVVDEDESDSEGSSGGSSKSSDNSDSDVVLRDLWLDLNLSECPRKSDWMAMAAPSASMNSVGPLVHRRMPRLRTSSLRARM